MERDEPAPADAGGAGAAPAVDPTDDLLDDAVDAVFAASRALVSLSARSIAAVEGVTLPQFRMLVVLEGGPTNLSGLATALDVAPSTAMRMVDRLVATGLVDRAVPPENRRENRITLTAEGRTVVRDVVTRRRRDLRAVLERIPRDQHPALAEALINFADAASALWPTDAVSP